jgi:diguanylate cyclase (GGDEF)-like protein/PAS domain S-box-containing protein
MPEVRGRADGATDPFRLVSDYVTDVVAHQVGGVLEWISGSVQELLGWTPDELVGTPTGMLWHPDDAVEAAALRDLAYAGQPGRSVLRIRHRDGHHVWLDVAVVPDRAVGEAAGIVVSLRDAGARVLAEQSLAANEEKLRLLAENATDMVFRSSADGRMQWVSPSVTGILGWLPDEMCGRSISSFVVESDLERMRVAAHGLAAGERISYDARFRCRDGSARWLSVTARPILDVSGTVVARVGGARDIDAEVRAREAAASSDRLFRSVLESATVGMATLSLDGRLTYANPALTGIVGRDAAWFAEHTFLENVHPTDRAKVMAQHRAVVEGRDVGPVEVRVVGADGAQHWVRRTGLLMFDQDGSACAVLIQLEDFTAEHRIREELARMAFHDELTGLHNRAWIAEALDHELGRDGTVGVLFLDVDDLQVVNDTLGHCGGDEVLVAVSERLEGATLRPHHLARFGADEFVLVLPGLGGPSEIIQLAEELSGPLPEVVIRGHRIVPSLSVGVAVSDPGSTTDQLLRDADAALLTAKVRGRGQWHLFVPAVRDGAVDRLAIEDQIRAGVASDQFVVFLQPVVRLADHQVVAHEALVRWQHPTRGLVGPEDFIDVAEHSHLIVPIGSGVLDQVCALIEAGDVDGPVAVNVSAVELARDDWAAAVLRTIERHRVDASRLVFEVTETAALNISVQSRAGLVELRRLGAGIHVDDFGTGFSSISLLRDLPVTGVKLDRRFVSDLTDPPSDANALAAGVAGLAQGLRLERIAEGIETAAQAELLVAAGWTLGQGYLFGRPAPPCRTARSALPGPV